MQARELHKGLFWGIPQGSKCEMFVHVESSFYVTKIPPKNWPSQPPELITQVSWVGGVGCGVHFFFEFFNSEPKIFGTLFVWLRSLLVLMQFLGCLVALENSSKTLWLFWGRLKRSARAVQLFGCLAVLETHALRY